MKAKYIIKVQSELRGVSIRLGMLVMLFSCEDFVKIDPPRTDLVKATVFTSDATAKAAIIDIYYQMAAGTFAKGDINSLTFIASLSSDELQNYGAGGFNQEFQQFNDNALVPSNNQLSNLWTDPYRFIYRANAVIEGLGASTNVSEALRLQLLGEAKFIRAFGHFYLTNLFGDVPLILSTDYRINSTITRTPKDQVYTQIIADLKDAKELLASDYSFSQGERVRPNKWAAVALLSRAYLYTGDWANAESEASSVINNAATYTLMPDINSVFLKNSGEAIWQLIPYFAGINTWEAFTFVFTTSPVQAALTNHIVNAFEPGDLRRSNWIGSATNGVNTFYYPFKYKVTTGTTPLVEYSMVLRLAEQYLIRAEARAHQNKIGESITDLDAIRVRAQLPPIQGVKPNITQSELLLAIEHERQVELFTEWGHRWLDLKRTAKVGEVLSPIKPNWANTAALYPIPQSQILNDPNMKDSQNPGY